MKRLALAAVAAALTLPALAQSPPRVPWTLDEGGIVRGDTSQPRIALVFTGGDYGEGAETILNALQERDIRASFFVTGAFVSHEEFHGALRRIIAEGHYLGPHSHSHPLYCSWDDRSQTLVSEEFFRTDLEQNIAELRRFGAMPPGDPILFIPPSEWFNRDQVAWAREMGVTLFNFTSGSGSNRDWAPEDYPSFVPSETIYRGVLDYEQRDPHGLNGFILLLHLGSQRQDKMHPWVAPLIDTLRGRGYEFVRIDQMLALPNHSPEARVR